MLNPHKTLLVLLGIPRGVKGSLNTLNAIVHPTKEGFIVLFYVVFSFNFILLRD
jgi:hypothetical protein